MSRIADHRRGLFTIIAAVIALAGLLVAGLQTTPVRTFALRAVDSSPVAVLHPGQHACEGPVQSDGPMRGVGIFGARSSGTPVLHAVVRSATGRLLSSGILMRTSHELEMLATLDDPVSGGRSIRVCVHPSGGSFSLYGAGAVAPGVSADGINPGTQFSLVLTRPATFLGSLDIAFERAAVFRPTWVGVWTFWTLVGLLVATLGLAGLAVSRASRDDGVSGHAAMTVLVHGELLRNFATRCPFLLK